MNQTKQVMRAPSAASQRYQRAANNKQKLTKFRSHSANTAPALENPDALYQQLDQACTKLKKAEPVERLGESKAVLDAYQALKAANITTKYGTADNDFSRRRNVFLNELKQMGIKNPDQMAQGSTRSDLAFIVAVVGGTSVLAVAAGALLPGDWGFFSSYLIGSISLVVLAVGSTAPGLLAAAINAFNSIFPDYRERVALHEAAHFLAGYLLGVPPSGYSLNLGAEHTEFAETRVQRRLFERFALPDGEVDALAVMAVAGIAAEGMAFDEVMGQTADLLDLQRILDRSDSRMSPGQQQNVTRWAVWQAASLLRRYKAEHTAVKEAMLRGAPVAECVRAIEAAN